MTARASHHPFTTLAHTALLGTDHPSGSARTSEGSDVAELVAQISQTDAAGALLAEAALLGWRGMAGRVPVTAPGGPVQPAPPERDDQPLVNEGLATLLNTMLAGANDEVLPEWLDQIAAHGWRAPVVALPALLDLGQQHSKLRTAVSRVLGARGHWLAAQQTSWAYAIERSMDPATLQSEWELASAAERKPLLHHARSRDAALGRSLLESTWAVESAASRSALIAGLRTALGADDEPFLEQALDDRRQDVRHEAAAQLVRLPSSALVARMTARAKALLSHTPGKLLRGAKLAVELPAECDVGMVRDGVTVKPAPGKGVGERAWWLLQIIGAVPPRAWTDAWAEKPGALIGLAEESEWSVALMSGWALAAVASRDAEWADALLRAGAASEKVYEHAPSHVELLQVLDAARRERFVAETLLADPTAAATLDLLVGVQDDWSVPFARNVLSWLRARITSAASDGSGMTWRLAQTLPSLALSMPHSLAAEAEKACTTTDELSGGLPRAIDRFIALVTFRHALHQELSR